jgi:release factor glutamine methyltransferase
MPDSAAEKPLTLCVQDYVSRLAPVSRAPASDVRHLLAACLACSAAEIRPVMTVSPQQFARFSQLFARCERGEPLAYVLGEWDFWGLTLKLQPGVLIPRADTECLVEAVLGQCDKKAALRVVDCGTGSGAVALALASECPSWFVMGVDKQPGCVACAQENAQSLGLASTQVVFVEQDWTTLAQSTSMNRLRRPRM